MSLTKRTSHQQRRRISMMQVSTDAGNFFPLLFFAFNLLEDESGEGEEEVSGMINETESWKRLLCRAVHNEDGSMAYHEHASSVTTPDKGRITQDEHGEAFVIIVGCKMLLRFLLSHFTTRMPSRDYLRASFCSVQNESVCYKSPQINNHALTLSL